MTETQQSITSRSSAHGDWRTAGRDDQSLVTQGSQTCVDQHMTPRAPTVRLLHTADWHIGRKFHQVDLLDDQRRFGAWLVDLVRAERIDAVLIAGDLFDRATPSGEAVDLLDQMLADVLACGTKIIAITGNHDSAERLHFCSRAMAGAGLHICAERRSISDMGAPIDVVGASGASVQVLPIPYLDPHRLIDTGGVERRHDAVLGAVVAQRRAELRDPKRSVVMAHTFITGGGGCESERPLTVGGSAEVGAGMFHGIGYVALGHLHRPQVMLGGRAAYSGAPVPLSFSEEHPKEVRIVECGEKITSHAIPVGVGRRVRTLHGALDDLLRSSKYRDAEAAWVRAELTDTSLQPGAMERLRERFPFILEIDQQGLRTQRAHDTGCADGRPVRSAEQVIGDYMVETFPDLDDDDTGFVHTAVEIAMGAQA